ncbi:MAG: Stf0 family sulfotransferase [Gammaproteobacteria bacterium]
MLATLPRSGSTFFATELWRTGLLGAPMEYLNPSFVKLLMQRPDFQETDVAGYWSWVKQRRTSRNGVFGYKMFFANYTKITSIVPEWLPHIAPLKVVFLTRSNVLEQAVSYSKAIGGNAWFASVKPKKPYEYDAKHISKCIESIQLQLDFWSELFAMTHTDVCRVYYEDLLVDLDASIERVAEFMSVPLNPSRIKGPPLIHVQRDSQSAEWVARYKQECGDVSKVGIGSIGRLSTDKQCSSKQDLR